MFLLLVVCLCTAVSSSSSAMKPERDLATLQATSKGALQGGGRLANEIMSTLPRPCCSVLFFKDVLLHDNVVLQELSSANGIQILDIMTVEEDGQKNLTRSHLLETFNRGRQFRRTSWEVVVVVASESLEALETFALYSLNNRLLVWSSKVIIITSLPEYDLKQLLTSHWTFSMMNTIVLNSEKERSTRWSIYTHLPYTDLGPRVIRQAVWKEKENLKYTSDVRFFPEKFKNFYGSTVNVTKLDILPMWFRVKEKSPDGSLVDKIIGNDYFLLEVVAKTLNFSFRELPVASWTEGFERVARREAFITPVKCAILETRMELLDFTIGYVYLRTSFAMAKPTITPNWSSLYTPLSNYVWLSILISTLLMPLIYVQVTRSEVLNNQDNQESVGWTAFMVLAVLIGQPQSGRLPKYDASRFAILTWFIFTFVVSTGYQGNLTAHLTLPKYPSRPETVEELVNYADRVTIPPWGIDFKNSFKKSGSHIMGRLADLMYVGPQIKGGLEQALTKRQAHLGGIVVMLIGIEKYFTHRDGTPRFYIGKEVVIPGMAGWPVPHDAPFKHNLDWCLQACVEAGIYPKWTENMLRFLRYENLRKMKEQRELQEATGITDEQEEVPDEAEGDRNRPLTLRHMQGTFGLFAIGTITAVLAFITEMTMRQADRKG